MENRLSQSDWERIRQFANTPTYDREPEMLAPDGDSGGTTGPRQPESTGSRPPEGSEGA